MKSKKGDEKKKSATKTQVKAAAGGKELDDQQLDAARGGIVLRRK